MRDDALNDITLTAPAGAPPDTPQVNINMFPVPAELVTFYAAAPDLGIMYAVDLRRIDSHNYGYTGLMVPSGATSPVTVVGVVNNGTVIELSRVQGNTIDVNSVALAYGARNSVTAEFDQGLWLFTGAFSEQRFDAAAVLSLTTTGKLKFDGVDTLAAWQPWTVADGLTWSSSANPQPSLGNGALSLRYIIMGKTVRFRLSLSMGTTTTFGTGNWAFGGFPFTTPNDGRIQAATALFTDNSAGTGYVGAARLEPNATGIFRIHSSNNTWGPAVPVATGVSDGVWIEGQLEIA